MNSIKLTYINYVRMVIKFMSSDFFVWCFIVVNFEVIWTRPYRDVVMFWGIKYNKKWSISTLREKYINWNWLDQAWGRFCRDASVRDVFEKDRRYFTSSTMASKCWTDDLNEICWCASFVCWPKNGYGFAFITKFSKIFVWTSPGAFDVLKVDVLNLLTSPGAFEIVCQVSQNELCRIFLLPYAIC